MLAELEVEAEALETVDPGIVAEYRKAQEVKKNTLGSCARFLARDLCADCEGGGERYSEKGATEKGGAGADRRG